MSQWNEYNYDTTPSGGGGAQSAGGQGFYDSSYDYGGGGQMGGISMGQPSATPTFMTPAPLGDDGQPGNGPAGDAFGDEPPLLEELGINVEHIVQKTLAVLNPFRATAPDVAGDSDLAGPLAFCLAFGSVLLLAGKVHFNYIYGIGVMGCLAMYALLAMMSLSTPVHFTVIVSVLGYCILPIVMLSAMAVVVSLQGLFGNLAAALAVGWCALSASKLFVTAFNMEQQQLLVAYPCSLLYAVFALITVF